MEVLDPLRELGRALPAFVERRAADPRAPDRAVVGLERVVILAPDNSHRNLGLRQVLGRHVVYRLRFVDDGYAPPPRRGHAEDFAVQAEVVVELGPATVA